MGRRWPTVIARRPLAQPVVARTPLGVVAIQLISPVNTTSQPPILSPQARAHQPKIRRGVWGERHSPPSLQARKTTPRDLLVLVFRPDPYAGSRSGSGTHSASARFSRPDKDAYNPSPHTSRNGSACTDQPQSAHCCILPLNITVLNGFRPRRRDRRIAAPRWHSAHPDPAVSGSATCVQGASVWRIGEQLDTSAKPSDRSN